ncbi:hypothetical protein F8388_008410 [Cannabis sativa]|uniref:Uncharacterized protein n=1 Tax=Cannabis sativa TaxID=3483 RepID=A0A7J6E5R1_CANSA|nr:hypothetical protein F8388_008410 [Cannabis sativa]
MCLFLFFLVIFAFPSNTLSSHDHLDDSPPLVQFHPQESYALLQFKNSFPITNKLGSLELSYNQIQGDIPSWLWNVGKDSLLLIRLPKAFEATIASICDESDQIVEFGEDAQLVESTVSTLVSTMQAMAGPLSFSRPRSLRRVAIASIFQHLWFQKVRKTNLYLNTSMAAKTKIKLGWMADLSINNGSLRKR